MKSLLTVVDYQADFVTGSLSFDKAALLDEGIASRIAQARAAGWDIAFTLDTHDAGYLDTREGKNLPVLHCVKGTPGHALYGKTASMRLDGDKVFEKPAFGSMAFANWLAERAYGRVELVGLVSNICVISNAVLARAALPEAEIMVDASLTASYDEDLNSKALDVMAGLQILVVK
jgi:nicotinamidase/pyrazinamidase